MNNLVKFKDISAEVPLEGTARAEESRVHSLHLAASEPQTSPLDIQDWHPSDWHLSPWGLLGHQSSLDARGEPRLAAHQDTGRAPRSQPGRRF